MTTTRSRLRTQTWLALAACAWAALAVVAFLWVAFNEQTDNLVTSFLCWLGGCAFWAFAYGLWERRRRESFRTQVDELEAHVERLQHSTRGVPYADPQAAETTSAADATSSTPAATIRTGHPPVSS